MGFLCQILHVLCKSIIVNVIPHNLYLCRILLCKMPHVAAKFYFVEFCLLSIYAECGEDMDLDLKGWWEGL